MKDAIASGKVVDVRDYGDVLHFLEQYSFSLSLPHDMKDSPEFKDRKLGTADALVMRGGTGHNAPDMADDRVVLFASVCPQPRDGCTPAPRYDPDLQFTGLTLFISLFPDLWDHISKKARQDIVKVMNWHFHMCLPQRLTLQHHFADYPCFKSLIKVMEKRAWEH